ncbi:uncharacterized protein LOC127710894 [Mytilus californianus]|uniref:uncharacterized protein LOC127710894 n=1 Tax=Mytilus californianus TaxID=6549 RepID=UPI00224566AB|nr:uncharacterized protein LOC127710894 [Mytilus californianus]
MFLTFLPIYVKYLTLIWYINGHFCQTAPTDSSFATIDLIVKPHSGENVQDTPVKDTYSTLRMEYNQETKWPIINIETQAQLHLTQIIMMCNILRKRTQRTDQRVYDNCCTYRHSDSLEQFYELFCSLCVQHFNDMPQFIKGVCISNKNELNNLKSDKYFEIYNQMKKRKDHLKKKVKRQTTNKGKENVHIRKNEIKFNNTEVTTDNSLHVSKRSMNDTGNSTIPGMADWEAILQMEYSKDPQWALVCVVFVVTLVLVGVWYCGMCKNKHTEYIDPVVTHNLKPEFVKDVVMRKARFLAWFKYLKSRRKHEQQKAETEALLSCSHGSEEDLFDQTDMSAF